MRIKTLILAITYFSIVFIVLPFIFVKININFNLTIIKNQHLPILGLIIILFGSLIFLFSANLFAKLGKGAPVPVESPQIIISVGLYSITRNPIYISHFIILLGTFLY
jgi:protein-S-isoprenylcysteine O-methyltransferase Ste14